MPRKCATFRINMSTYLKFAREKRGMSRAELARALGCKEAMIGHIERGDRRLTAERAIACEAVLGVDRALLRPDIFKRAA